MTERPDYVKCIAIGESGQPGSWCGRPLDMAFHFQDATHAALNGRNGGRLLACRDCVDAITNALHMGSE